MFITNGSRAFALQKCDDSGAFFANRKGGCAVLRVQRQGAGNAVFGEVFHDTEEEGDISKVDAFFVDGENVFCTVCGDQVVAVFNALGDRFFVHNVADAIGVGDALDVVVGKVRVNGHA